MKALSEAVAFQSDHNFPSGLLAEDVRGRSARAWQGWAAHGGDGGRFIHSASLWRARAELTPTMPEVRLRPLIE